jgi:methanogenic corrinoid protein MtbC1
MQYGRAGVAVQVDALAEELLREAVADMQVCATPETAAAVLLATVERAGGRAVPARSMDETILPLDLTFGTAAPLVAEVDPASMARLRLEQILPIVADVWALRQESPALRPGDGSVSASAGASAGGGAGTGTGPVVHEVDDGLRARYLRLLLAGRRSEAIDEVLDQRARGLSPRLLAVDLIGATQAEVGGRWWSGAITIGQEHRATSISRAALVALTTVSMPAGPGPDEQPRPSIVLACAEGEWHTMPGEIVGHVLSWMGWDVTFLGPSVPADQLAGYLARHRPTAVALSCSLADRLIGALAAIDAARSAGVPCLVGGSGFGVDGMRAVRMGASAWSRDIDGALRVLQRWSAGKHPAAGAPQVDRSAFDLLAVKQETIAATREIVAAEDADDEQRARVGRHLGTIFDYAVNAQLVDDPRVLQDCVRWTNQAFLRDGEVLRVGIEAMAEISGLAHPAAGELLADAALHVEHGSS